MVDWARATFGVARGIGKAADRVSDTVASGINSYRTQPGRHARKTAVLAPGDAPPAGSYGTYQDYRFIHAPDRVKALESGTFPLGRVIHPQRRGREFPIYLQWDDFEKHMAIVGPSGSGKSRFIIAPWILTAAVNGLTTINVDVKGDLVDTLHDVKQQMGITQNFSGITWDLATPQFSRPWNLIAEVRDAADAAAVAQALLGAINPADPQKYFAERDHRWLRGLLLTLAHQPSGVPHPQELYRVAVSQQYLTQYANAAPQYTHDIYDLLQWDPNEFPQATSGLSNRLSWLANPTYRKMLSGEGPKAITADRILDSGATFIVGARLSLGEMGLASASVLLGMLRLRALSRMGAQARAALWTLDEAGRYADRIDLQLMLDMLRGAGSSIVVSVQDVQHLGDKDRYTAILTNCDGLVTLRGVSPSTAAYFGERLGTVQAPVVTHASAEYGRWTPTTAHQTQPLLGPNEVMYPPVDRGGLVQLRSRSDRPFLFELG